ncbi:NACHT domain-containing protein [Streptomyces sp. NPDC047061]|uniref:NACHT domain-containing protein n=1 Tax=Streptomyces sp. NPDC047061 TaxID=3154605 RepID=UPI0034093342
MAEEAAGSDGDGPSPGNEPAFHQTSVQSGDGTQINARKIDAVHVHVHLRQWWVELARAIRRLARGADRPAATAEELARAADELASAVGKRWQAEARLRRLDDPMRLPVFWAKADEETFDSDHPENVWGDRDAEDLTGDLDRIAELHERLPYSRLVVLGDVGSGKTVLSQRFVLERLAGREPGAAVPEIFSLGSWNLDEDSLDAWLSRQLIRDQPWLRALTADGGTTLADELVRGNLILPVLDGFDEIPERLRDKARNQLDDASRPYVLTSRVDAYRQAVLDTRGLHRAAVITLAGLSPDAAVEYLRRSSPPKAGSGWEQVRQEMSADPDGPLGTALSTPLMVHLAAIVHGERGTGGPKGAARGPEALLRAGRSGTRDTVEDGLLSGFLPVVYRDGTEDEDRARVQEWLGYLAHQLGDGHDLKWWELGSRTLSRPVRTVLVGTVTGLAFGLFDTVVVWSLMPFVTPKPPYWIAAAPLHGAGLGLLTGIGFGLVYAFTDGGGAREPSGVSMRLLGRTRPSRRTLGRRLAVGLTGGFGFGFVTWFAAALVYGVVTGTALVPALLAGLRNGLVGGLVSGPALGLAYGGGAGGPEEERPRLKGVIGHFRRRIWPRLTIGYAAAFSGGLVFSVMGPLVSDLATGGGAGLGTVLVSAFVSGLGYGPMLGLVYALTTALSAPIPPDSTNAPDRLLRTSRTALLQQSLLNTLVFGVVGWLVFGSAGNFPDWAFYTLDFGLGIAMAYGLALTAWGHWMVLARIWLPLTGRLPWAVHAFLKDAHRRGVLRHSGAVYQFRHALLKEHLARTYKDQEEKG